MIIDVEMKVLHVNKVFCYLMSVRKKEFLEQVKCKESLREFLDQHHCDFFEESKKCIEKNKKIVNAEVELYLDDGSKLFIHQSFIPLHLEEIGVFGVMVIFKNVSDDVELQKNYRSLLLQEQERSEQLEKKVAERTKELKAALDKVVEVSRQDPLTKLLNRRAMKEAAVRVLSQSSRYERICSLMICDLDFFKPLNDTYGHLAGDKMLVKVAELLSGMARSEDFVCRFGGEEFIILLPDTNTVGAKVFAERCTKALREFDVSKIIPEKKDNQTMSVGIVQYSEKINTLDLMVDAADQCLYTAKENGRDCVVVHEA
jgi:diguanylate cyclase (GGDEF)-like protein